MTWEAAQDEEVRDVGGGEQGRNARTRKRSAKQDDIGEEEHLEALKNHGARLYAKPAIKAQDVAQDKAIEQAPIAPARQAPAVNRDSEIARKVERQILDEVSAAASGATEAINRISAAAIEQVRVRNEAQKIAKQRELALITAILDEFF